MANFFTGSPAKIKQVSTFTPQQQGLQNQGIQQLLQMLQSGAGATPDISGFAPIAEQAKNQFYGEVVPGLAERFTAMGGGGGRSSAFQGALGQAGVGLQSSLASQGAQFGQQQQGLQQNLLQLLLGLGTRPSFENVYKPGDQGFLGSLGSPLAQGLGQFIGSGGNPLASLINTLSGLFGGRQ